MISGSRTLNATIATVFAYAQYAFALISGFVLFPVIIWRVGAYDTGLWLMSGELIGYLLLGDLGVFAVLPWLVAARHGVGDYSAISRYLIDGLAIGVVVGAGFLAAAAGVWWADPRWVQLNPADWAKLREPLALLLALTGVGFPLRVFGAVLLGLQDVVFGGISSLVVSALSIGLSAALVLSGFGLTGLALATGFPPVVAGLAAGIRLLGWHQVALRGLHGPGWVRCRHLIREGFGPWLATLGVRLLSASNALVFAGLGRPEWATVYAATGKAAQVAQPLSGLIPDSGLIGLSQLHGSGDRDRTQRTVLCLLLLYLIIPGGMAVAIGLANPWFVRAWLGGDFFAGEYVSMLIAVNLIIGAAVGGLFKVVAVVGNRIRIGIATLIYGAAAAGLGYLLGRDHGMAGLAEGAVIAGVGLAVPYGLYVFHAIHGIGCRDLLNAGLGRWAVVTAVMLAAAAWLSGPLADYAIASVIAVGCVFAIGYVLALRPVIAVAPWPDRVLRAMKRVRLIPTDPAASEKVPSLEHPSGNGLAVDPPSESTEKAGSESRSPS